jgi:hypothetical protein
MWLSYSNYIMKWSLSFIELLFIYLSEKNMEQDFKMYDKETEKKFDKLGIPYVW